MNPSPRPRSLPSAREAFAALAIAVAGMWAFYPGLRGGWLWDDDQYVTDNPLLRSAGGLARIWLGREGVNYFPLTSTVEWLEWHRWRDAPLGYHVVNLLLHVAGALLVWRVARRFCAAPGAWIAGLLFAVHPLAVESVAWVSELKNTLSLVLALLALLLYLDGRRAASLAVFVAALVSKSTVAPFPCILLLIAWWRNGRIGRSDWRAAAPFFGAALIMGMITVGIEQARAIGSVGPPLEGVGYRLVAAGRASAFYLGKILWPMGLNPIYPRWRVAPLGAARPLACVLWAALAAAAWKWRARWGRQALLALGAFLFCLLPVLGLVPMAYLRLSWVADHFAYAALVPIAILAGAVAGRFGKWAVVAAAAAALVLGALSRSYCRVFFSPESLWTRTIDLNPGAWSAHNDLGAVRFDQGRLPDAIAEFSAAVRLNPRYAEAYNNLGVAQAQSGQFYSAIVAYRRALELKPAYPEALCNLGNALLQTGRAQEAVRLYEEALRLKSPFPEAEYNLGLARGYRGQ